MAPLSSTRDAQRVVRVAVAAAAAALTLAVAPSSAQQQTAPQPASPPATQSNVVTSAQPGKVPFKAGERLDYEVRWGSLRVGQGNMTVQGIEDVRGKQTWHAIFAYSGSLPLLKVNDRHESWFDLDNFSSRRFYQSIDNPGYDRERRFEIFPERGMYKENDKPEEPTPQNPLDEASFLYFVRTLPLKTGDTYQWSRYFKAQGNPIRIRVLRRERVRVPAGEFNAIVVQPTFNTKGLFSEGGKAEVWISDDSARVVLQIKSKLSVGSINLFLKSHNTTAGKS